MKKMVQLAGVGDPEQIANVGGEVINGFTYVPLEYIQKFADNPKYLVLVSEISRPGVQLFATKLEYLRFPPGTEENKVFNFGVYSWDECFGMPFLIMIFPSKDREYAEELAVGCDIRFADGVPTVLGFGEASTVTFPINGPSVFRLENLPDSKVYAGALNPEGGYQGYQERIKALLTEERQKTKDFLISQGAEDDANALN